MTVIGSLLARSGIDVLLPSRWRSVPLSLAFRPSVAADPSGTPVPLTKREYTLLLAFIQAPQQMLTREQLL
jgi:DNA-binding response OmpR family regulator